MQLARQKLDKENQPTSVKEFQFAVQNGQFKGSYQDWLAYQNNMQSRSALTPIWSQGPNGELTPHQLNNRGGQNALPPLPEGHQWAPGNMSVPTGTGTLLTPKFGQPNVNAVPGTTPAGPGGAVIPKDVAGAAAQTAQGKLQATKAFTMPEYEATTDRVLSRLDELTSHKGIEAATGYFAGKLPIAPTPDARDFTARLAEVQGGTWLQGVQQMRGLGQLSNREGARIADAVSRLQSRDVSTSAYKKAIADLKNAIEGQREAVRKETGASPGASQTPTIRKFNPETGKIE